MEEGKSEYIIEVLYDIQFQHRFSMKYNLNYCSIIDLNINQEIYYDNDFSYPFNDDISYHIFNDSPLSDIKFLCSDGEYLWQPEYPNSPIPISEATTRNGQVFGDVEEEIFINDISPNAITIDNMFYFLNLGENHSENENNQCCLVAIQILAGYYDTFYCDDYVPEKWDLVSIAPVGQTNNWKNWPKSPGAGHKENPKDSRMLDFLTNYTIEYVNPNLYSCGLSFCQQKNVLDYYLFEQCVGYILSYCEGNYNDYLTQYNKAKIQSGINNNHPVIVNGAHHSAVAFGYDDDYVYVHNGWGYCARVPWSIYTCWDITYQPSSMYLIPSQTHSHSNNYYSTYTDSFYCSCGEEYDCCISDISSWPLSPIPNLAENSFYYYYDDHMSIVTYLGAKKTTNNQLILGGNNRNYINVFFADSTYVHGLMINGKAAASDFLGTLKIKIDFLDSTGYKVYSYDAKKYTRLLTSVSTEVCFALNCDSYIKEVRIEMSDFSMPLDPVLSINKLVFNTI